MNLLELLRDRRGRLLEIPILIAFACAAVAVGVGQRSWWKGPVYAGFGFFVLFGALFAFGAVMNALEDFAAVKAYRESRFAGVLSAAAAYLLGVAGGTALGAFAAAVAASHLGDSPESRLRAMRAVMAGGALLGAIIVRRARGRPARF